MKDRESARPLFSDRADDPALGDALEAFALGLAERIDHLQEAECRGEFEGVVELAERLADEALELGHRRLGGAAREVARVAAGATAPDTYEALVELTELARRVRLGHRGAF